MTESEMLQMVKVAMDIGSDEDEDENIKTYLEMAEKTIIEWRYHLIGIPDDASLESQFEMVKVMACINGYGQIGGTGETNHHENGIIRVWKYEDMAAYIRSHVPAFVRFA